MISKENLLKNFANEDKDSVIRIYNNLILAKNKDIPVFSKNFCSPNIWSYFVENFNIGRMNREKLDISFNVFSHIGVEAAEILQMIADPCFLLGVLLQDSL